MNSETKGRLGDVIQKMNRSIITMFIVSSIVGVTAAICYWIFSPSSEKLFHCFVIAGAIGYSFPAFTIVIRVTVRGYFMGLESMENQSVMIEKIHATEEMAGPIIKKIDQVVDKAIPISESVEEVVFRAKGMSEDIEKIAHRIREVIDNLNGSFDIKSLEKRIEKVADSLTTIASVFTPLGKKGKEEILVPDLPEFDPLKAGGKRKGG